MPATSLDVLTSVFSRLRKKGLEIAPEACVRLRSPKATCDACGAACPHQVIDWSCGLSIDLDLCDECGRCAAACMNGVISLAGVDGLRAGHRAAVHPRSQEPEKLYVACRKDDRLPEPVLRLPCLGALEADMIVETMNAGFDEILILDPACAGCASSSGHNIAADIAARFDLRLAEKPPPAKRSGIRRRPMKTATPAVDGREDPEKDLSRRHFLGDLGGLLKEAGLGPPGGETDSGTIERTSLTRDDRLGKAVPAKRERMLRGLAVLRKSQDGVARIDALLPRLSSEFYAVTVDSSACDLCDQCTLLCPTGALEKTADKSIDLEFYMAFCSGCRLCADVCPKSAVSVDPAQRSLGEMCSESTLVSSPKSICSSCGDTFAAVPDPDGGLCAPCAAARDIDSGFLQFL